MKKTDYKEMIWNYYIKRRYGKVSTRNAYNRYMSRVRVYEIYNNIDFENSSYDIQFDCIRECKVSLHTFNDYLTFYKKVKEKSNGVVDIIDKKLLTSIEFNFSDKDLKFLRWHVKLIQELNMEKEDLFCYILHRYGFNFKYCKSVGSRCMIELPKTFSTVFKEDFSLFEKTILNESDFQKRCDNVIKVLIKSKVKIRV